MPTPRETIEQSNLDDATKALLLAVFDEVWAESPHKTDMNGYRIAGGILDLAAAGQRCTGAIHRYAAYQARAA